MPSIPRLLTRSLLCVTIAIPLLGCGHALVPLQHRGNEITAVVYYDATATAFDICARIESTRQFMCSVVESE